MSVNCVYCGHVNPDGSTVCQHCGRTLPPPAGGSYGQQQGGWGGATNPGQQGGSYPPADQYGQGGWQPGGGGYGQSPSYGNPQQSYGEYGQPGGYPGSFGQAPGSWGVPPGGAMAAGFNNPAVAEAQGNATKAMIFSIVGVLCCFILGIVGIVMGGKAKATLQQYGVQEGQTQATVGIVLGWVAIGIWILGIILNVLTMLAQ